MRAAEVLRRYAAGERDFRGVNLRGQNFRNKDLSEADFSGADIRSADFTGATLCGANFSGAKAGLQRWWAIVLVLFSWVLAGVSGYFSGFAGYLVALIFSDSSSDVAVGWFSLIVLALLLTGIVRQGTGVGAVGSVFVGAIAGAFVNVAAVAAAIAGAVAGTFTAAIAVAFAAAIAGAVAGAVSIAIAVVVAITGAVAGTFTVSIVLSLISVYIGWRALKGDPRHAWIRSAAVAFAAIDGASFRNANLSDATFAQAMLKGIDLRGATLTRTNWHQSKNLDRARVGGTILFDTKMRELAVTHRGTGQSYKGIDLKAIYLPGADLRGADLMEADISNISLEGASLEGANLTRTNALGTNFHQARLTGACIEDWRINPTTNLSDLQCDYIYRKYDKTTEEFTHRLPVDPNSTFAPAEFTTLFQVLESALETINLTFTEGIDWQAFFASFQALREQHPNETVSIQGMEYKGDAFVVRLEVDEGVDRGAIETEIKQLYQAQLKALEAQYEARLRLQGKHLDDVQAALEDARQLRDSERRKNTELSRQVGVLADKQGDTYITFERNVGSAFNQGEQTNITAEMEGNQIERIETLNQNKSDINQTVTSSPGSNINAFQGNQNQVTQTQSTQAQLSQAEVIEMLAQIKALIEAAELPGEVKIAANANLQVAQKAAAQEEPRKESALDSLENMAETLERASKTVEAGKTLWGQVKPILAKIAGWLGAAAGSLLLG